MVNRGKVCQTSQRVKMGFSQNAFLNLQELCIECFRLVILALASVCRGQTIHSPQRTWVLIAQYATPLLQHLDIKGLGLREFPLSFQNCG